MAVQPITASREQRRELRWCVRGYGLRSGRCGVCNFAQECCTCFTSSLQWVSSPVKTFAPQGCGNGIKNGGKKIDTKHCMLAWSGDSSEICGGANSHVRQQLAIGP